MSQGLEQGLTLLDPRLTGFTGVRRQGLAGGEEGSGQSQSGKARRLSMTTTVQASLSIQEHWEEAGGDRRVQAETPALPWSS